MQRELTANAAEAIEQAKHFSQSLKHPYVGTEHLLVGLLSEGRGVAAQAMMLVGLEAMKLVELIEQLVAPEDLERRQVATMEEADVFSPRAEKVLERAQKEAERFQAEKVGTEHLLLATLKEQESVATRLLNTMGVNLQKLYIEILAAMGEDVNLYKEEFQNGKMLRRKNGTNTPLLDQFSRDLTRLAREGMLDPVLERDQEIDRVIQILSRRMKNNPCLIGEPGVGKTAIADGLAHRIVAGDVPDLLAERRVVTLDLSGIVAGSKYRGEFEERIKRIMREVINAGNVILFIDEFHTVIGAGSAEGSLDASNILKPSLSRGEMQVLGATTIDEYRKYVEKDAALERRFQPIMVEEPTIEQAIHILQGLKGRYEQHHNVIITDEGIISAVKMSDRYINDRYLPDKAIDIIDEAASRVKLEGYKYPESVRQLDQEIRELSHQVEEELIRGNYAAAGAFKLEKESREEQYNRMLETFKKEQDGRGFTVGENEIAKVVSIWTKIPVEKLEEAETEKLRKLEKILHQRVVGQDDAVATIARAVKRGRVGLKDPNRPVGSFLLLGPTGVGKTELSKALAEAIFGSEESLIRVDMSEYMEKHSVSKIIGSPPGYVGYDEGGQLSEKVRRAPYSVVLFDEIEKAHPDVFNVLLQVLDDGHITDSQGRKIDFKNTVIIMTSNVGAQTIVEPKKLGFVSAENEKQDYEDMKSRVMEEVKRLFKPEFLNRIDDITVFRSLNQEDIKKIVNILLRGLAARCQEQLQIRLTVRDSVKTYIAEKGFDKKYGARPLRRTIQTEIEDRLAQELLEGNIRRGDQVALGMSNKQVAVYVI